MAIHIPISVNAASALVQPPPLALYLHFPWCVQKCPYCDFNSHELSNELPEQQYIDALLRDLDFHLPTIWGRPVVSMFMGGGTPSLFSARALDELFSHLRARLNFSPTIEITLEANPGTIDTARFTDYYNIGINRLSIGIQSFQPGHLQQLGRIHDRKAAIAAAESAHRAGFTNFNLDLMYGLSQQTLAQACDDIQHAIALHPSHISHYQLTIEPNTAFAHHPPALPADSHIIEIEQQCRELLANAGYMHYEISAFAQARRECVHNLNYWHFGDYLGLGAGAHSKITMVASQQIHRHWNVKHPREYLANAGNESAISGRQSLQTSDRVLEFMMNNLRLHAGFPPALFQERTGLTLSHIEPQLHQAQQRELLEITPQRIAPTELGRRFLNDLLGLFVSDDEHAA